jgi:hypothetical protein
LIDRNRRQVEDARSLFSDRIKIVEAFLTLDNLDFIKTSFAKVGMLSIDVDGNDYWFLEHLIDTKPTVICVEYNSTFGNEPITVPYDPTFDRNKKHPKGWYHGASLAALSKLCALHGYGLSAVSSAGTNAFFTTAGSLDPDAAWKPNSFRETFSGVSHDKQWDAIKHLPFERVYLLVPTATTDRNMIRFAEKNRPRLGIDRFGSTAALLRSLSRHVTKPSRASSSTPRRPNKRKKSSQPA